MPGGVGRVGPLPLGRKSVAPPPVAWSLGVQLRVAVDEPMVMVSVVLPVMLRVTVPVLLLIVPWNAPPGASCAWAGCAISATAAQDSIRALRLSIKRRETGGIIGSSTATGGYSAQTGMPGPGGGGSPRSGHVAGHELPLEWNAPYSLSPPPPFKPGG